MAISMTVQTGKELKGLKDDNSDTDEEVQSNTDVKFDGYNVVYHLYACHRAFTHYTQYEDMGFFINLRKQEI